VTEYIHMHHVLDISDERAAEIEKHVMTTLGKAGRVDEGTKTLMESYDAEAIYAGMQLMRIIRTNKELLMQRKTISIPKHPKLN